MTAIPTKPCPDCGGRGEADDYGVPVDCHASRDGDCIWLHCPQNRDGEPKANGRHCPLDRCSTCRGTGRVRDPNPPLRAELLALLRKAARHAMTPAEINEQRVSFIYGQVAHRHPELTKDRIRQYLREQGHAM